MHYRPPTIGGFERIPEIDGLRGVAILIVMIAHYTAKQAAPGGFGVTLFFVISGFIITRLFFAELSKTKTISIGRFYFRRFLRLTPALFVCVFAIAATTVAIGEPFSFVPVVAALVQMKNYQTLFLPDHIGAPLANLGIFWSLAVEEHFYLFFPPLFLLLSGHPRRLAGVLLALITVALLWRFVLVLHFNAPSPRTYMGSDTRFDSPLTGAALACLCAQWEKSGTSLMKHMRIIVATALALLAVSFASNNPVFRETLRYTLQNIGIALILFAVLYSPGFALARQVLSRGPLHAIGIISYSLYLWHVFILYLTRRAIAGEVESALVAAAISFAVAYLSWRYLEKGTEHLRARFSASKHETSQRSGRPAFSGAVALRREAAK